jgi:hypothetical protein
VINEILTASGLPYRETQYTHKPPAKTYAVYMDDIEIEGGDLVNLIRRHNITVELYEPKPDPEAEASFERELNNRGLKWTKQSRYWIAEAQRYQVIYEDITYFERL